MTSVRGPVVAALQADCVALTARQLMTGKYGAVLQGQPSSATHDVISREKDLITQVR